MANNLLLLLFVSLVAILPVLLIKQYINNNNKILLLISLLCYCILIFMYIGIFKDSNMGIVYTVLQLLQILIVLFVGVLLFGQSLDFYQKLGVVLAFVSIFLLDRRT